MELLNPPPTHIYTYKILVLTIFSDHQLILYLSLDKCRGTYFVP